MEKQKNNNFMVIVLVAVILIMAGVIAYMGINNNSKTTIIEKNGSSVKDNSAIDVNSKVYTYSDTAGTYKYTSDPIKASDDDNLNITQRFELVLNSDGTYILDSYIMGHMGYIGNYIIVNNTIQLNYWYLTDNGAGGYVTSGSETLTISDNNILVSSKQDRNNKTIEYKLSSESATNTKTFNELLKEIEENK